MGSLFTCKLCGKNELIMQGGVFVCTSCGTKYSVEDARSMVNEYSLEDNVAHATTTDSELEKILQNGETFMTLKEWGRAQATFEEATQKYPEDYRSWWGAARAYSYNLDASLDDTLFRSSWYILSSESWTGDGDYHPYYYFAIDEANKLAEKEYFTNEKFLHAWKIAIELVQDKNIQSEIKTNGEKFIKEHKKTNCQKVVDSLYAHPQDGIGSYGGSNIIQWQSLVNSSYKAEVSRKKAILTLCTVLKIIAAVIAIAFVCSFGKMNFLTGVLLVIIALALVIIGAVIKDRLESSTFARNIDHKWHNWVKPANKRLECYYIHKANLDKMK